MHIWFNTRPSVSEKDKSPTFPQGIPSGEGGSDPPTGGEQGDDFLNSELTISWFRSTINHPPLPPSRRTLFKKTHGSSKVYEYSLITRGPCP